MKSKILKKTIPALFLGAMLGLGIGFANAKPIVKPQFTKNIQEKANISNLQHKKDLKFITDYMIELRERRPDIYGETRKNPIPGLVVVDKELWDKIKDEGDSRKPYDHYMVHYNIPADVLFITEYNADEKRTWYIGEKIYRDNDSNGLKQGTEDSITWIFYSTELDLFGSTYFGFLGKDKYEVDIEFDNFVFSEGEEDYQKVLEKKVKEYKGVVHDIAERLKTSKLQ